MFKIQREIASSPCALTEEEIKHCAGFHVVDSMDKEAMAKSELRNVHHMLQIIAQHPLSSYITALQEFISNFDIHVCNQDKLQEIQNLAKTFSEIGENLVVDENMPAVGRGYNDTGRQIRRKHFMHRQNLELYHAICDVLSPNHRR